MRRRNPRSQLSLPKPLLGDPLLLFTDLLLIFIVTTEKIDIIVIIIAGRGSSSSGVISSILASLSELLHASSERLDMVVPAKSVGRVRLRSSSQSLEHGRVSLAGDKAFNVAVLCKELIQSLHSPS